MKAFPMFENTFLPQQHSHDTVIKQAKVRQALPSLLITNVIL